MLILDLVSETKKAGYPHLSEELDGVLGVFDAVQDAAEADGAFMLPDLDMSTGNFFDDQYNNVLDRILEADRERKRGFP